MFAALMVLVTLVAIPYGTVEPWWIGIYEGSVFSLGLIAIVEGVVWNRKLPLSRLSISACVIVGFVFLQTVTTSVDALETRLVFFKAVALLTTAFLLSRYTDNNKLNALVTTVVAVAVASAVFGIARQTLQHNELGFGLPLLRRDTGFGQFINKNHFSLLMEMALGLATGLVIGGGVKRQWLLFYGAAIALMWTALILTSSRGGLFTMLGQLVFVLAASLWSHSNQFGKRLLIPAAIVGLCLLLTVSLCAIWLGGDLLVTRLESLSGEIKVETIEPHAGVRRREIWGATLRLAKQHPVMGSGFGAYSFAIPAFHDASGKWTPEAAHNDYLELLASGGVIGLALLLWLTFELFRRTKEQLASSDKFRRAACLGALTGIFGVLLHSFVDFGIHVTANSVILVALLVIATGNFQWETKTGATSRSHKIRR